MSIRGTSAFTAADVGTEEARDAEAVDRLFGAAADCERSYNAARRKALDALEAWRDKYGITHPV